jgi:hypothetical protein
MGQILHGSAKTTETVPLAKRGHLSLYPRSVASIMAHNFRRGPAARLALYDCGYSQRITPASDDGKELRIWFNWPCSGTPSIAVRSAASSRISGWRYRSF